MCPTLLGRLQTRFAVLVIPALIAVIVSLIDQNPDWLALIGLYLVMGCILDVVVYRPVFSWQPGWLTFIIAVAEWILLLVLALTLEFEVGFIEGSIFYWAVWLVAQTVRIVLLPLIFLTRLEDGGEFRQPVWTIPAQLEQLPVLASAGEQLPERLSGLWQRPSQIGQALPAPSQIGPIPPEFLAAVRQQQAQR
jgi:hypothetical protein